MLPDPMITALTVIAASLARRGVYSEPKVIAEFQRKIPKGGVETPVLIVDPEIVVEYQEGLPPQAWDEAEPAVYP